MWVVRDVVTASDCAVMFAFTVGMATVGALIPVVMATASDGIFSVVGIVTVADGVVLVVSCVVAVVTDDDGGGDGGVVMMVFGGQGLLP